MNGLIGSAISFFDIISELNVITKDEFMKRARIHRQNGHFEVKIDVEKTMHGI